MIKKENKITKSYNEYLFLKEIFSFADSRRKKLHRYLFIDERSNQIISVVLKYLLHVEQRNPIKVEKIIRKWCVIICYYYAKLQGYKETAPELDQLLLNNLTFDALNDCVVESNEIIGNVFNDNETVNKKYNEHISVFCDSLASVLPDFIKHKFCIKYVKNLLTNDNYFFTNHNGKVESFNTAFYKYPKSKSFDRLIAEVLNTPKPIKFTIEIDEEEFFKCIKNYKHLNEIVKGENDTAVKKAIPLMFGYMVAYMIEYNNLDLSKKLEYLKIEYLLLELNQGTCDIIIDGFIPQKEYEVNKEEIVSFEFIFNNEKYKFSPSGLTKL